MMIREARIEDIPTFEIVVTPEAREGFIEHFNQDAVTAMARGIRLSTHVYAAFSGDEPIAMLGCSPISILRGLGWVWVVPTIHICKHPLAFARASRRVVSKMLRDYSTLTCWIHESETREMTWMRWLGFKFARLNDGPMIYAVLER